MVSSVLSGLASKSSYYQGDGDLIKESGHTLLARDRARGLLTLTHQKPPVDVQAIIDLASIPVVERVLVDGMRGTIGDVAGQRSIILNRRHRFSSEQERRWVLAEELGHVLLGHQLVESTQPGKPTMGLLEERRLIYEGEARALPRNS